MSLFQDNLVKIRTENNYTQEKLAELLSISRDKLSKWENGIRVPDLNELLEICDIFDCDLDYLVGRIEQPTHSLQDISDTTGLSIANIKLLQEWNKNRYYHCVYEPKSDSSSKKYIRSSIDYLNNILESFPELLCRIDNVLMASKERPDRCRKALCMEVALKLWNHITDQDSGYLGTEQISKFASDFIYERLSYLENVLHNEIKSNKTPEI